MFARPRQQRLFHASHAGYYGVGAKRYGALSHGTTETLTTGQYAGPILDPAAAQSKSKQEPRIIDHLSHAQPCPLIPPSALSRRCLMLRGACGVCPAQGHFPMHWSACQALGGTRWHTPASRMPGRMYRLLPIVPRFQWLVGLGRLVLRTHVGFSRVSLSLSGAKHRAPSPLVSDASPTDARQDLPTTPSPSDLKPYTSTA